MPRELKLTAIDLRMDKLLLLRSVLRAVSGKTVDRWSFSDDANAHVAISTATPSPSRVGAGLEIVMPRKHIALVDSNGLPEGTRDALGYPVRPAEFVDLLNAISDSMTKHEVAHRRQPAADRSMAAPAEDADAYRFAFALRELLRLASRHPYRIKANGVELHIIPASRSMLRQKPLEETSVIRLIQASSDVHISPMTEKDVAGLMAGGARLIPLDTLLWRIGLESQLDHVLPDLPKAGYFALKRWPDFGGMAPHRSHLRMASVLTLSAKNISELAKASESTLQQARGFINACALLDLVEIRAEASGAPPLARQQHSVPRKRFGAVFQTIRSALGLGIRGN